MSEPTEDQQRWATFCTCDMPDGTGYCAKHDLDDEDTQTPLQAIRETAWQQALALYKQWEQAYDRAFGGTGGSGYRDPFARAEVGRLRAMLDAVIVAHNFQGTRADPMLSYVDRRTASWDCPPMVGV